MSGIPKITIEKRIFKINDKEDFVLEYPSNYEEIVDKKLQNLEKEYEESKITTDQNKDNNNQESNTKEEKEEKNNKENKGEEKENSKDNNSDDSSEEEEEEKDETNNQNNNGNEYYAPIGEIQEHNINNNEDNDNDAYVNLDDINNEEGFLPVKQDKDYNKKEEKNEQEIPEDKKR